MLRTPVLAVAVVVKFAELVGVAVTLGAVALAVPANVVEATTWYVLLANVIVANPATAVD